MHTKVSCFLQKVKQSGVVWWAETQKRFLIFIDGWYTVPHTVTTIVLNENTVLSALELPDYEP